MKSRFNIRDYKSAWTVGAVAAVVALSGIAAPRANAQGGPPDQVNQPGSDFIASREIPAGTPIKVVLLNQVSSDSSQVGDPVKVRIAPDDTSGIPKSVIFVGRVHEAVPATNKVPGEIALRFDALAPVGRWQPAGNGQSGPVEEASAHFDGGTSASGSNKDVGIGAAAGALIGGSRKRKLGDTIEGGLLGALGGYAVQKATTHSASDIQLKNGQEVTITLRHPITLRTELIAS